MAWSAVCAALNCTDSKAACAATVGTNQEGHTGPCAASYNAWKATNMVTSNNLFVIVGLLLHVYPTHGDSSLSSFDAVFPAKQIHAVKNVERVRKAVSCTTQMDIDYPGNDLENMFASLKRCSAVCQNNQLCTHFTYVNLLHSSHQDLRSMFAAVCTLACLGGRGREHIRSIIPDFSDIPIYPHYISRFCGLRLQPQRRPLLPQDIKQLFWIQSIENRSCVSYLYTDDEGSGVCYCRPW